jgi:choline kinase
LRDVAVVVGYRADAVEARQAALEARHGVRITLVHNDKAEEWNNCYSLWLARDQFAQGALLVNGDTVHPVDIERTLLAARELEGAPGVLLALDNQKVLAEEEMKVTLDDAGRMQRITKLMEPSAANGEYIGATLIEARVAADLAAALEATWRRDPDLYYEDGFQTYVDTGGVVGVAPIGQQSWVEVDNHDDLARAREIACHY